LGFFSMRRAMTSTPARADTTPTGTTAPFSAMSGAVIWMSVAVWAPVAPSALRVSSMLLASKAALFHSARAWLGVIRPAAASRRTGPARHPP
jgi:hypothetical protein